MYEELAAEKRPILLYGMGDGAEKIFNTLVKRSVKVSGVFASEGFVRGQSFLGFPVMSLAEAEKEYGDFVAVLCFALEGEKTGIIKSIKKFHTLYSPNLPVYGEGIFDKEYILSHIDRVRRLYNYLADDLSRELFVSLLKYNITGETDYLFESKNSFSFPQGFFTHTKRHIDVGAFDGDTVIEFSSINSTYSDIAAFEPDKVNFRKLVKNTSHIRGVLCENTAVTNRDGVGMFSQKGNRASSFIKQSEGNIRTVSIDGYCGQRTINDNGVKVGSIKIDAEGADKEVLQGAVNTLYNSRPNIMVALYHRAYDLLDIPLLIRSYDYKYKLYLRKKEYVPAWDVFLFAEH